MTRIYLLLTITLTCATSIAHADSKGWFRSENSDVARGNERMAQKDAKGALAAYDEAAKALPNAQGVHLDRGLALMAQGESDKAREALQLATQPPADKSVRASAYYNLGNSFYKTADAAAKQDQHEDAQKLFHEAVDAYKQSLRLGPGNANAAWNLQLAARRIAEEKEKQKKEEQQQQDQQNQDQQNQDQQNQDQQNQDQQNQDQQNQDQQNQDQKQPQQDKQPQPSPSQQDQQPPQEQKPAPRPSEAERALDALQDSEQNLQQYRARQRAMQERRKPDKDW